MNSKTFIRLETIGGAVVFAIASFLHFFYKLSGKTVLGALLGSVNESVWEHLKILSIAYLIWTAVELLWARPPLKAFVWAKAVGVYSMCIFIAGFYYLYTSLFGKHILAVGLTSSLAFSILAHLISCKLTTSQGNHGQFFYTGIMLLFLMFVMILCFTYYPPETNLFKDPVTGTYGVPSESFDHGAVVLDTINANHHNLTKIPTKFY